MPGASITKSISVYSSSCRLSIYFKYYLSKSILKTYYPSKRIALTNYGLYELLNKAHIVNVASDIIFFFAISNLYYYLSNITL